MNITKPRPNRAGATAVLASMVAVAALCAAAPASAATKPARPAAAAAHAVRPDDGVVGSCAGSGDPDHNTCITVYTETKNTTNHTQYVGQIVVTAPDSWAPGGLLEAWAGNGPTGIAWYQSEYGTYQVWTIDQWIKNGSGICGSYTAGSSRSVACISISV
ncbi:hypothetical protein [Streptacidiphilus albus]|uniref:hypothetical protein n=1 Tax=Streptacidiphilus albus TaxID=105425 RepID=UPI00054B89B2|nr:hypothetical protein [Streptacidiphilus albus]